MRIQKDIKKLLDRSQEKINRDFRYLMFSINPLYGKRFQKVLLIIIFAFLTLALIKTWMTPATGFESSIYTSTPLMFWIALFSGEFIGISLFVLSLSSPGFNNRQYLWKFGLLFICLGNIIVLSLFIIRGYAGWDLYGDVSTHIMYTNEILRTGHIAPNLIYPALHLLTSEICLLTSLSPLWLSKIIPVFFSLICFAFMYLFIRSLTADPIIALIAGGVLGSAFLFSPSIYFFSPNDISCIFLPVAFFLITKYLQETHAGWGLLLTPVLILYPVFHPLTAMVLGTVLLTLWIAPAFRDIFTNFMNKRYNISGPIQKNLHGRLIIPFLIFGIWFIFWYSSFTLWGNTLADMVSMISSEGAGGPSHFTDAVYQVSYAQEYGYNVFELILKNYGAEILLVCLTLFSFPLFWKIIPPAQKKISIFSWYGPWAIVCSFVPVFYIFNLSFGPLRFLSFALCFCVIFVSGLLMYFIMWCRENKKRVFPLLVSILIILSLFIFIVHTTFCVYPSPYRSRQSLQNTQSEISGMTVFFEYRNSSVPYNGVTLYVWRFAHLLLTPEESELKKIIDFEEIKQPPWHFGYDQYSSISSSYLRQTSLILTKHDQLLYVDNFPAMAKFRYYPEEFNRVKNDPGVNRVYSNGEFDVLIVRGKVQSGST